jgi:hypothetical protein
MQSLVQWFTTPENAFAVLVTVGVTVLLICCLECAHCPCREQDDLFRRHEL